MLLLLLGQARVAAHRARAWLRQKTDACRTVSVDSVPQDSSGLQARNCTCVSSACTPGSTSRGLLRGDQVTHVTCLRRNTIVCCEREMLVAQYSDTAPRLAQLEVASAHPSHRPAPNVFQERGSCILSQRQQAKRQSTHSHVLSCCLAVLLPPA
jgi:hypothetical protein